MTSELKTISSGKAQALGLIVHGRDANLTADAIKAMLSATYDAETVAHVIQGYMETRRGFIGHDADHYSNFLA